MIFAAGFGTRLKPFTLHHPKALVPVDGKPMLRRVIENIAAAGVTEIVVNVHHFAQQIIDYLAANDNFGLDIRISDESQMLLDTGGGIKKAAQLFSTNAPILIHNVDILSNVNLASFYDEADGHDATLLVSRRDTSRYLIFDDDMRLTGWINVKTGETKPQANLSPLTSHPSPQKYAFSGIHVFSPHLSPLMAEWPEKFGIIDFYLSACQTANVSGFLKSDLELLDVGKLDSLDKAEKFIKQQ